MKKKSYSWMDVIPIILTILLFISQIIVGFYLLSDVSQNVILAYIGVGLYFFFRLDFWYAPNY